MSVLLKSLNLSPVVGMYYLGEPKGTYSLGQDIISAESRESG